MAEGRRGGCGFVVDEMKGLAVSDHSEANNAPLDAAQVLCARTEDCSLTPEPAIGPVFRRPRWPVQDSAC